MKKWGPAPTMQYVGTCDNAWNGYDCDYHGEPVLFDPDLRGVWIKVLI